MMWWRDGYELPISCQSDKTHLFFYTKRYCLFGIKILGILNVAYLSLGTRFNLTN